MKPLFAALCALLLSCNVFAADFYVDGLSGNDANAGTSASPLKTVWQGWMKAQPGDTVLVKPTMTYSHFWFSRKSGEPGKPITIKGSGPGRTKVQGKNSKDGIMLDTTAYVNIENFDVVASDAVNRSAHGIFVKTSHHVNIVNNRVKGDCAGIQGWSADYLTIDRNEVYDSSKRTLQEIWCSGISTHEALDVDDNTTDYKQVITNNIIYGTLNVAEPGCTKCTNSDGSGIIIDDSRRTQTDNRAYKGRHLVANNIIYNNGGRGITSYISDNVDVFNNTIHGNNVDPAEGAWRPGEITLDIGTNIRVMYNILSSDGLKPAITDQHYGVSIVNTSGSIVIAKNLIWNPQGNPALMFYQKNNSGTVEVNDDNRFANPGFTRPTILPTAAYTVKSSFNAHRGFKKIKGAHALTDITGKVRLRTITAGAYQ